MKKLFFVLYSVLFLVGCGDMPGLNFGPYEPMSECPDYKAMNFNIIDCHHKYTLEYGIDELSKYYRKS